MCLPATVVSQIPCCGGEPPRGPFPGSMRSSPGGCRQSCEASARLCRDALRGCFPSSLTEKLQWMATCFCERFARNFAVSPDRLCIALFSNHSDSLARQIPAPNLCAWHALGPVLLRVLSPLLRLLQNPGSSGHSAPCRATAVFWVATSPLVAGACGQEGLVVERSGVSDRIPWDTRLRIQRVAERSSRSGFYLVSTREQASC